MMTCDGSDTDNAHTIISKGVRKVLCFRNVPERCSQQMEDIISCRFMSVLSVALESGFKISGNLVFSADIHRDHILSRKT